MIVFRQIINNELHIIAMDTIKMLLAATTALLLGAFAWNWQNQKSQAKDAPSSELARLKKQLEEIKREEANLLAEKRLREMGVAPTTPDSTSIKGPSPSELAEQEAKMREIEERNKQLEEELSLKEKEKSLATDEAGLIAQRDLEKSDKELRRARNIREALLMAKVSDYVNDPNIGTYITMQLVMPENVQVDSVLAVRRKDGIAGTVRVSSIEGGEAVADVLPGAGPFTPEAGDELIIPPQ